MISITFKEIVPFVIIIALSICISIAIKTKSKNIHSIDGFISILGSTLGIIIIFLNLRYSNNYLISLGPLLAITCLFYLKYKDNMMSTEVRLNFKKNNKISKIINIFYWLCIAGAILSYREVDLYTRPLIFFVLISLGVSLLGIDIIFSDIKNSYFMIFKILLISTLLSASAYFISPYPIGSDPWKHAEYIEIFLQFHHITVPINLSNYYCNYPLTHLLICAIDLIGNLTVKESMFIIGMILILSTGFVYLIAKNLTDDVHLAMLSLLLLNFAESHIQWSIEIIAMSFGIAIYTMIIYLITEIHKRNKFVHSCIILLLFFIMVWTHTVSSFISLISIIAIYIGNLTYMHIYRKKQCRGFGINHTLFALLAILMIYHWMDPAYPFLESISRGFEQALFNEAKLLDRSLSPNSENSLESILNIIGFLMYIFFGIIGSLYYLSRSCTDKLKVSIIFMLIILFFWFFAFPIIGIRNILPNRWPAFIYVSLVIFSGKGLISISNFIDNTYYKYTFILLILFSSSFFMITAPSSDTDSPIYAKELNQRLIWTQSEMELFEKINKLSSYMISTDVQTKEIIFENRLKRYRVLPYLLTANDGIDLDYTNNSLIIWRKISLLRPIQVDTPNGKRAPEVLLGDKFKRNLDEKFSNVYDTGDAKAYIGSR